MENKVVELFRVNSINAVAVIGAIGIQDIYYVFGAFMLLTVGIFNICKIIQMYKSGKNKPGKQ